MNIKIIKINYFINFFTLFIFISNVFGERRWQSDIEFNAGHPMRHQHQRLAEAERLFKVPKDNLNTLRHNKNNNNYYNLPSTSKYLDLNNKLSETIDQDSTTVGITNLTTPIPKLSSITTSTTTTTTAHPLLSISTNSASDDVPKLRHLKSPISITKKTIQDTTLSPFSTTQTSWQKGFFTNYQQQNNYRKYTQYQRHNNHKQNHQSRHQHYQHQLQQRRQKSLDLQKQQQVGKMSKIHNSNISTVMNNRLFDRDGLYSLHRTSDPVIPSTRNPFQNDWDEFIKLNYNDRDFIKNGIRNNDKQDASAYRKQALKSITSSGKTNPSISLKPSIGKTNPSISLKSNEKYRHQHQKLPNRNYYGYDKNKYDENDDVDDDNDDDDDDDDDDDEEEDENDQGGNNENFNIYSKMHRDKHHIDQYDNEDIFSKTYIPGTLTKHKFNTLGSRKSVKQSRDSFIINNNKHPIRKQADAHASRVYAEGRCKWPRPKVVPVQIDPAKTYIPHCTILHRCDDDTGCCLTDAETCVERNFHSVELYFYVTTLGVNDKRPIIEKQTFVNHTECQCVSKSKRKQVLAAIAPAELRRASIISCKCPKSFEVILQQNGTCRCDCSSGNDECNGKKKGIEHFSMNDRKCMYKGLCQLPTCEFGIYDKNTGGCPRDNNEH